MIIFSDKEVPDMFNCPQNKTYEVTPRQRFIEGKSSINTGTQLYLT